MVRRSIHKKMKITCFTSSCFKRRDITDHTKPYSSWAYISLIDGTVSLTKWPSRESEDCSQSPIFSWDRLDIPRLTVTGILIFKCTEGAGVGDYSSIFLASFQTAPVAARNTKCSISMILRKNRGLWTV